jgi:hypothetical protein
MSCSQFHRPAAFTAGIQVTCIQSATILQLFSPFVDPPSQNSLSCKKGIAERAPGLPLELRRSTIPVILILPQEAALNRSVKQITQEHPYQKQVVMTTLSCNLPMGAALLIRISIS